VSALIRPVWLVMAILLATTAANGVQDPTSPEPRTLAYASRDGTDLLLDLYVPAKPIRRPVPVIVFLHGGGWSGGTRTTGPDFKRYFAQDGFAMASIEYRLTPSITFPANVEDVRTAIRWLKANAAAHALDPDRICLWGTSAGGHLAAVAALASVALHPRHHRPDRRQIDLVVARGKFPISFLQRRLAVRAAHWPRDHRLVRGLHQRSAATLAPQTAFARSLPPRLLAAIGFLARRGWHAGVVRRLRRQPKTGLQFRHPRRQRLNLRPQRSDQGVLLVMRQAAEVRKLGHPKLELRQPGSHQAAIFQPVTPLRTQGDEQIPMFWFTA